MISSILSSGKRLYFRLSTRRSFITRHPFIFLIFVFIVVTLAVLHFFIIPTASGAYNDECYLPQDKLNNLRYAIKTICETMDAHNMTYWLDYGTLVGAVRRGDVLPWDGDADISFLRDQEKYVVHEELIKIHGIQSNGLQANYKGLSIDYVRWEEIEGSYSGQKQTLLHKYYPSSVLKNENMLVLWNHELDTFPKAWVTPRKRIDFQGSQLAIPNDPHRHLAHRYPTTYWHGFSVPFKWKCYVPCFVMRANGCP
ncbi:uncharacterized protein RP689 [Nematostella vectensis]|uniref:uncharacterized protein RP689 n=1 Tax=Nematostella vectensis TaxID=45351 RepID=UPI0020777FEA|nr:uncharacterized protein RP689 [Nematostella vectensis]